MDEDKELALEEERKRTPAERMRRLEALIAERARLGLAPPEPEPHKMPYGEVQRRMLDHISKRSHGYGS